MSVEYPEKKNTDTRRVWIICAPEVQDDVNASLEKFNAGTGPLSTGFYDKISGDLIGFACGWQMPLSTYNSVVTALEPFVQAGAVGVFLDEHGNVDSNGLEIPGQRFSKGQLENIYGAKRDL